MTTSFWTKLIDLLSPRRCLGCQERLSPNEGLLCSSCAQHLSLTRFSQNPVDNPLARLFWGIVPIERAAALFYYEPATLSASVIHSVKYFGRSDVAEQLGRLMADDCAAYGFFEGIDGLVPVPLTKGRYRHRGYNQSELIARGMADVTHLPVYHRALERVSFMGSQTRLNIIERRENVEHAFRLCQADGLRGKHLLLVDDVVTTGSTLMACATVLLQIPEVRISIATLGFAKN